MNQGMAHLDNIWGCGGGNRPVVSLTNKARVTVVGYILSTAYLRSFILGVVPS